MSRDEEWGLFKGKASGLMQAWDAHITDRILESWYRHEQVLEFITRGDKETLEALLTLNNAQIRAQQGESNE